MLTTAYQRAFPRTLVAAALAVAATVTSFGITVSPARAQAPVAKSYSATLASALEAPQREVINGVLWNCAGDSCKGPVDGARAGNTCARVAKKFGQVTRFATPKGEMTAEELQRCNGAA